MKISAPSSRNFAAISLPRPVPPPVTRIRWDFRRPSLNTIRLPLLTRFCQYRGKHGAGKAPRNKENTMASVLDRFRLDGKVALITGGARGIGRATAEAFVAAGARAVLLDRDADEAVRVAGDLGNAEAHALDVTSETPVNGLFDTLAAGIG